MSIDYTAIKKEADELAKITNLPAWAHVMIITYFDNRPCQETQEKYKQEGLLCTQYLYRELQYILNAIWKKTPEFLQLPHVDYLVNKYRYQPDRIFVALLDRNDKKALAKAFSNQLGIHWTTFPFTEKEVFGEQKEYTIDIMTSDGVVKII